jgi:hypothetical protein
VEKIFRNFLFGILYTGKISNGLVWMIELLTVSQNVIVGPKETIRLMAEVDELNPGIQRGRWLAEACKDKGYRFSTRLHMLLWGSRRGT